MTDFIQALAKCITGRYGEEEERRASICAACPEKEQRSYAEILNAEMVEIKGFVCTRCDCPIATKVFAIKDKNICPKWK